jgi:tripartite-type tricarboxylate transporter receptor subunit TctC
MLLSRRQALADWAAFERRAREGRLRMAHNPILLFALPLGMLEAHFGGRFEDVLASTRAEIIAALDQGRADAGFLPTISLLTPDGRPPLRPLVTFGGERNPWFAGVPTYREVGAGERTAITGAIALFGPPGMAPAVQASVLQAVRDAAGDPGVAAAASALRYPLEIKGPDELTLAMDRNARVVRDMRQYLRAPI